MTRIRHRQARFTTRRSTETKKAGNGFCFFVLKVNFSLNKPSSLAGFLRLLQLRPNHQRLRGGGKSVQTPSYTS
ncbi:MAG: hypothetical protein RSD99_16340, partial [Janthinobacterium sp.]